jgi:hypothetical protein
MTLREYQTFIGGHNLCKYPILARIDSSRQFGQCPENMNLLKHFRNVRACP